MRREGTHLMFLALSVSLGCSGGGEASQEDDPAPPGEECRPGFSGKGDPEAVRQYCVSFGTAVCRRAFTDCGTELRAFHDNYSDRSACEVGETEVCQDDLSALTLDPASAQACLQMMDTSACSLFAGAQPGSCTQAMVLVPPSAATCTLLALGSIEGEVTTADLLYADGYSKTYCLCLPAGKTVDIRSEPSGASPIPDTYLFLFGPSGALLAQNDDVDERNLFARLSSQAITASGPYMIVLSGFSPTDLGGFRLTVSVH